MTIPGYRAVISLGLVLAISVGAGCMARAAPGVSTAQDSTVLAPCPARPNCVSSDATDSAHRIAPLAFVGDGPGGNGPATWAALIAHLEADSAYTIITRDEHHLQVEARTRLLRFVDDLSFHMRPAEGVIAVRSASRLGYSDLGANRRRVETIRTALQATTK